MYKFFFFLLLLFFSHQVQAQDGLTITSNNQMLLNTDTQVGSGDFTLRSKSSGGFGGMYVESTNFINGQPFYGYALDETAVAFHYYDAADNTWKLYTGKADNTNSLQVDNEGKLYSNTTSQINGFTNFTMNTPQASFGGMYINSEDDVTGKPFFGYAIDDLEYSYHYYDITDNRWKLYTGGTTGSTEDALQIDEDNRFYLNTDAQINEFTNLTLDASQDSFGGMYVNSRDNSTGKPFYGYSVGTLAYSYHYFDIEDTRWKLFTGNFNNLNAIEIGSDNLVRFDDKIKLGNRTAEASDPDGTILYTGNGFYGKRAGSWYRLDETTSTTPTRTSTLEHENQELKNRVQSLEERIARLESLLTE